MKTLEELKMERDELVNDYSFWMSISNDKDILKEIVDDIEHIEELMKQLNN